MSIKIYGMPFQHNTMAMFVACKLAGVEYEFVNTNIMVGEHKTPEMLAKFPMHTTPSMEDTDTGLCMTETCACLRYIARKGGSTTLFPSDLKLSAVCDMVMDHKISVLGADIASNLIYPGVFSFAESKSDEAIAEYIGKVKTRQWPAVQKFIDENGGPFVCGNNISVADLSIWGFVKIVSIIRPTSAIFTECEGLKKWFDAVDKIAAEHITDENLGFWKEKKESL
mmetsp:Transcript_6226/g.13441  ORF Transcript_6226/g.13441 Transcript_6226/m.13441 type:complete len:225 (-) Transcript_6226:159-833(-)